MLLIRGLLMTIDSHPLYLLLHHLKSHFPKLIILQIPHTGVLPMNCKKVLRLLHEENYAQFPCIPCPYCSRLLYPQSAKWLVRNNDIIYPFQTYFQINLTTSPRNPEKIAICDGCKSNPNNRTCLTLAPIPQCIRDVPYSKRKYLSPIYLHNSLGRSTGANPFVEYRSLVGQMGYSKIEGHFPSIRELLVVHFCNTLIYPLLAIVGIIHHCVMLVTGYNKIIPIYLLIILWLLIYISYYLASSNSYIRK